jgi:hypothetical protein
MPQIFTQDVLKLKCVNFVLGVKRCKTQMCHQNWNKARISAEWLQRQTPAIKWLLEPIDCGADGKMKI